MKRPHQKERKISTSSLHEKSRIEYDNFNVTFTEFSACYCSPMRALSFAPDWPAKKGGMTNLLFLSPVYSLCLCGQVSLHLHRHPFQPQYFKCGHYANYTLCLSALVLCTYCHLPAEFITTSFISYVLVPVANILNRLKKKNYSGLWWKLFFSHHIHPSSLTFFVLRTE